MRQVPEAEVKQENSERIERVPANVEDGASFMKAWSLQRGADYCLGRRCASVRSPSSHVLRGSEDQAPGLGCRGMAIGRVEVVRPLGGR